MSNRRKVRTPAQVAATDQALAHARVLSREPATTPVVIDFAERGRCEWCSCDMSTGFDPDCAGCQSDATTVFHVGYGKPTYKKYLICDDHKAEAITAISLYLVDSTD